MTQRSIGSFGQRRERVELTFDYFGETIRVSPTFGEFSLIEDPGIDPDAPEAGLLAVRHMIDSLIHAEDVARFLKLANENGQGFEDLKEIVTAVVEAATDRPTQPRSDSSDSRDTAGTRSGGDDFSQALQATNGRPDLQLMVMKAQEHRKAS